ncbi:hypothetical protein [Propionivibrio sp.]
MFFPDRTELYSLPETKLVTWQASLIMNALPIVGESLWFALRAG